MCSSQLVHKSIIELLDCVFDDFLGRESCAVHLHLVHWAFGWNTWRLKDAQRRVKYPWNSLWTKYFFHLLTHKSPTKVVTLQSQYLQIQPLALSYCTVSPCCSSQSHCFSCNDCSKLVGCQPHFSLRQSKATSENAATFSWKTIKFKCLLLKSKFHVLFSVLASKRSDPAISIQPCLAFVSVMTRHHGSWPASV